MSSKLEELTIKMEDGKFNATKTIEMYECSLKLLSEIYFYKNTINNIFNIEPKICDDETKNSIIQMNQSIDIFISETNKCSNNFVKSIETFYKFELVTTKEYYKLKNQCKDILNLIEKINALN